jgi:SAM-dependent methyltransferase
MTLWIGSPSDVRSGDQAKDAIRTQNDAKYYDPTNGITKVDYERWVAAQKYEASGWMDCWQGVCDDRSHEHFQHFDGYRNLKKHLGNTLEVGCGPFTQLKTILNGRAASRITLLDPLIRRYLEHPNCSYKTGYLNGLGVTIRDMPAEHLGDMSSYDTIVCINVLEHVRDALRVLTNIYQALKFDGVLVMGERSWDDFDPHELFDAGHPIRLKKTVITSFKKNFNLLFENGDYFIGQKPSIVR